MPFLLSALNKKAAPMVIVLVLLSSALLGVEFMAPAATDTSEMAVGVNLGDWARYRITASWTSNGSSLEPPYDFIELERIEWVKNLVLAISGTNITFERVVHYENGTETTSVEYIDLETGACSEIGTLMFIAANLAKDDVIHASLTEDHSLTETVARTYMGVVRETNHLNVSSVYDDPYSDDITLLTANYYWDKVTGVLCERPGSYVSYIEGLLTSMAVNEKMIDTNLWGPNTHAADGVSSSAIIIGTSVMVIGLLAVVLIWRHKGRQARRSKR